MSVPLKEVFKMTIYEHIASGGLKVGGQGEYSFSEPTCNHVYNDLIFFLNESKRSDIDQVISKRYARAALVFLAFYVESLANLLIDEVGERFNCIQELQELIKLKYCSNDRIKKLRRKYKLKGDWPEPLNKFQAAYFVTDGKDLSLDLDTSGIQDLFLIRNQIIAHPPARSIVAGTGVTKGKGLTEKGKSLSLKNEKLKHLPNIYSEFASGHTQKVYNETKDFLNKYHNLVAEKLSGLSGLHYLKKL